MTPGPLRDIAAPFARLIWAAAWRAQSLHLAFFIVPALLLVTGRALVALAFPLLVIVGPGDSQVFIGRATGHLREPGCWVALAPCAYAERAVPGVPSLAEPAVSVFRDPSRLDQEPFVEMPRELRWRHLWFLGWLAWFLFFLHAYEQRRNDASGA